MFYLGENGEIPLAQAMRERFSLYNGYMTGDGNGGWKSLPRHDDFDFELPEPDSCKDFRLAIKGMMPADADEKKVDKAVQVFYNEVRDYLDDRDITVYLAGHDIIEQLTAAMHYNYFVLSAMFVRMGNYMFMLTVGCD